MAAEGCTTDSTEACVRLRNSTGVYSPGDSRRVWAWAGRQLPTKCPVHSYSYDAETLAVDLDAVEEVSRETCIRLSTIRLPAIHKVDRRPIGDVYLCGERIRHRAQLAHPSSLRVDDGIAALVPLG